MTDLKHRGIREDHKSGSHVMCFLSGVVFTTFIFLFYLQSATY